MGGYIRKSISKNKDDNFHIQLARAIAFLIL